MKESTSELMIIGYQYESKGESERDREREKGDDIPHMRSKACVQVFLAHVLCVSLCVSKLFKNHGVSVCAFGVERFSAFIDANRL